MSVRELASRVGINRETVAKAEASTSGVRETTYARLEACLSAIEDETGADTPDLVTSTIELPDGTKVMFAGPADGVAEAAARYVRERSL